MMSHIILEVSRWPSMTGRVAKGNWGGMGRYRGWRYCGRIVYDRWVCVNCGGKVGDGLKVE
jgi:hypothetical protein